MNIRRLIMVVITFTLVLSAACSTSLTANLRFVTADVGLRMRIAPDLSQRQIETIPFNGKVTLLEESGEVLTIAGATGRWSRVNWKGLEGWVFGGFLAKEFTIPAKPVLPSNVEALLESEVYWLALNSNRINMKYFFKFEDGECGYGYSETSAVSDGTYSYRNGKIYISASRTHPDGETFSYNITFKVLYLTGELLALRSDDVNFKDRGVVFKLVLIDAPL